MEEGGTLFLYIKTIERSHSPKNLWEKIQLSKQYSKYVHLTNAMASLAQ